MTNRNSQPVFRLLSTQDVLEMEQELFTTYQDTSSDQVMAAIQREEGLVEGFGFAADSSYEDFNHAI